MKTDSHETIRHIIDKTLAGSASPEEQESLARHLPACAQCRDYLSAGTRVVSALSGFSFDVDPALQAKVMASLMQRAQQLGDRRPSPARLAWISIAALALTFVGSFIDLKFGGLVAVALGLQPSLARQDLLNLWILPSLGFCLLIPALLALSAAAANQKGRAL